MPCVRNFFPEPDQRAVVLGQPGSGDQFGDWLVAQPGQDLGVEDLRVRALAFPLADGDLVGSVRSFDDQGHSHGLVDPSIKRSREGLQVVGISLALLAITAGAQAAIYFATNSIALLADLIHNAGDALTAIPLAAAFLLRSDRAERGAGLAVVLTILASAITAVVFAILRIIHPLAPNTSSRSGSRARSV